MGKLNELRTTQAIVKEVLLKHPFTRNSDNALYVKVCEKVNPAVISKPFWEVLARIDDYGIPQFETVRRTRQKIQHDNPELAGSDGVEAHRMLNEEAFKKYARGC